MTIIEILIVIALIGTIMTIVMTNVLSKSDEAKIDLTKISEKKLGEALKLYKLDNNRFPTTAQGLAALLDKPDVATRWRGPYTESDKLLDAWGNAFRYAATAGTFSIDSSGPDAEAETQDDIAFPDQRKGPEEAPLTIDLQVPKAELPTVPSD